MDATRLPSGTVYPALSRLLKQELAASNWEDPRVAQNEKRPPRRYYEINAAGQSALRQSASRFRTLNQLLPDRDDDLAAEKA